MTIKDSSLYSILQQTCPRCHEGKMFVHNSYSSHFAKMNKTCAHCGLDFNQDYFGAMYVSYGLQVAIFVTVYVVLRYTVNPSTSVYVAWMIGTSVFMLPLIYRTSRVIWAHLFIAYQGKVNRLAK